MATLSLDDPRFQPLTPEEEEKRKKQKKITEENKQDLVRAGTDETDIDLPAEDKRSKWSYIFCIWYCIGSN